MSRATAGSATEDGRDRSSAVGVQVCVRKDRPRRSGPWAPPPSVRRLTAGTSSPRHGSSGSRWRSPANAASPSSRTWWARSARTVMRSSTTAAAASSWCRRIAACCGITSFNLGYRVAYETFFARAADPAAAVRAFREQLQQHAAKAPFMKGSAARRRRVRRDGRGPVRQGPGRRADVHAGRTEGQARARLPADRRRRFRRSRRRRTSTVRCRGSSWRSR